jgi:hypothetical protein
MFRYPWNLLLIVACASPATVGQDDPFRINEDHAVLRSIGDAGRRENLHVLQHKLNSVSYRLENPERYARIVYGAFLQLYADGTEDVQSAHQLEQEYLLSALGRPDQIPVSLELDLVLRLRANMHAAGALRRDEVRAKTDLIFHAWRRMEEGINPAFNFADRPTENVVPPLTVSGFSGMAPTDIADPKARSDYIAAVEKNRTKGAEYNVQVELRNIKEPFFRHVETFLISALASGAVSEGEVLSNMSLVRDDKDRNRVLSKIRSRFDK